MGDLVRILSNHLYFNLMKPTMTVKTNSIRAPNNSRPGNPRVVVRNNKTAIEDIINTSSRNSIIGRHARRAALFLGSLWTSSSICNCTSIDHNSMNNPTKLVNICITLNAFMECIIPTRLMDVVMVAAFIHRIICELVVVL